MTYNLFCIIFFPLNVFVLKEKNNIQEKFYILFCRTCISYTLIESVTYMNFKAMTYWSEFVVVNHVLPI